MLKSLKDTIPWTNASTCGFRSLYCGGRKNYDLGWRFGRFRGSGPRRQCGMALGGGTGKGSLDVSGGSCGGRSSGTFSAGIHCARFSARTQGKLFVEVM